MYWLEPGPLGMLARWKPYLMMGLVLVVVLLVVVLLVVLVVLLRLDDVLVVVLVVVVAVPQKLLLLLVLLLVVVLLVVLVVLLRLEDVLVVVPMVVLALPQNVLVGWLFGWKHVLYQRAYQTRQFDRVERCRCKDRPLCKTCTTSSLACRRQLRPSVEQQIHIAPS